MHTTIIIIIIFFFWRNKYTIFFMLQLVEQKMLKDKALWSHILQYTWFFFSYLFLEIS